MFAPDVFHLLTRQKCECSGPRNLTTLPRGLELTITRYSEKNFVEWSSYLSHIAARGDLGPILGCRVKGHFANQYVVVTWRYFYTKMPKEHIHYPVFEPNTAHLCNENHAIPTSCASKDLGSIAHLYNDDQTSFDPIR